MLKVKHSSNPPPPSPFFLKGWMDFLKIGQKGGGFNFFFNKGRDRKKGWDGVIRMGGGGREGKENLQNFFNFFKKLSSHIKLNPTTTALLLQEATQKNSQINEQDVVMSLCPSLFTATCAPFAFLSCRVFSVLGHSTLQNYVEF